MTCNLAVAAALLFASEPSAVSAAPAAEMAASPVSAEPAFKAITDEAASLKSLASQWLSPPYLTQSELTTDAGFIDFSQRISALAQANMAAHLDMRQRGTDGDLTCILRGIAEDLPVKLAAIEAASAGDERKLALEEMVYLLNDNVEVILAPPHNPSSAR